VDNRSVDRPARARLHRRRNSVRHGGTIIGIGRREVLVSIIKLLLIKSRGNF
jgi:hypothetical protein